MISAALILLAVAVLYAEQIKAFLDANAEKIPKPAAKHWAAIVCIAMAFLMFALPPKPVDGEVSPPAVRPGPLNLSGLFTGPSAADDAAALSALCDELACAVAFDGEQSQPRLTTGWAIADLRSVARDIRLRGETFGDRQPLVREAVKAYLDRPEVLGKNGGPLSPQDRARWIAAFRDIARAAEAAVQ